MKNKIYYKYLDLEGAIKSLLNLTLKYSSPQYVNDPTECFISGFYKISESEKPKAISYFSKKRGYRDGGYRFEDDINDNYAEYLAEIRKQLTTSFRFLSLSHSNNILSMWYHYADKYKGIVIGYDEDAFASLYDVKYLQKPPLIKHNCILNEVERDEQFIQMLTTKSEAWSYEQEARDILYMNWSDKRMLLYDNGFLPTLLRYIKEICFGMNCTQDDRRTIQNICLFHKIQCPFFETKLDFSNYLSIQPIK